MRRDKKRRERHLREVRARKARKPAPPIRFECSNCGHRYEDPHGALLIHFELRDDETGEILPTQSEHPWRDDCPVCQHSAFATNEYVARQGNRELIGFADTPEQRQRVDGALEELLKLGDDSSLDQIIHALEQGGPEVRPAIIYLEQNHGSLTTLAEKYGVGLVGIVFALFAWMFPRQVDQPPVIAPGISEQQMDRLIDELRRSNETQERVDDHDDEAETRDPGNVWPEGNRHGE